MVQCHAIALEACPGKRLVANAQGEFIYTLGRLLAFARQDTYEASNNKVAYLADALRVASGSDEEWERFQQRNGWRVLPGRLHE